MLEYWIYSSQACAAAGPEHGVAKRLLYGSCLCMLVRDVVGTSQCPTSVHLLAHAGRLCLPLSHVLEQQTLSGPHRQLPAYMATCVKEHCWDSRHVSLRCCSFHSTAAMAKTGSGLSLSCPLVCSAWAKSTPADERVVIRSKAAIGSKS